MKTFLFAAVCALTSLLCTTGRAATAPDFNLPDTDGKPVNLNTLLERGPVLLDFWATWCKPCLKAMPKLVEIHDRYKSRGLTVLGINEDGPRSQAKIKPFTRANRITFPVVLDNDGGILRRYQVQALPTTFLIAPGGEIALRLTGYAPGHEKTLIRAIESLLPAPTSAPPPKD